MNSAARSPIMIDGAFVFPVVTVGMTDASATRRPSMPCTRSRGPTTAAASPPILHVPTWWWYVIAVSRTYRRTSSAVLTDGPGYRSTAPHSRERRGGTDPPAELDGRDQALEIGLAGEDVRVERDGILGRRAGESQGSTAERAHHPAQQREAVVRPVHPRLVHRHHEVDRLDVGRRQVRSRAPEEVRLARGEARRRRADLALRGEDHRRQKVVVQVLADAGQVGDDVDPERAQPLRGPHAGEQEELRRSDGSAAQDDLRGAGPLGAAVLRPLDADAAGAVEHEAPGVCAQDELEGVRRLDGPDVRRRRAVAHAVLDAVLHERHAVLRHAVVVGVRGDAALVGRLRDRHVDRIGLERGDEAHRSRTAGLAPLDPLVDGPHVLP